MDMDQIFIFRQWNHTNFTNIYTTTDDDILYKITEEELDILCNDYIYEKLYNIPPLQTLTGPLQ